MFEVTPNTCCNLAGWQENPVQCPMLLSIVILISLDSGHDNLMVNKTSRLCAISVKHNCGYRMPPQTERYPAVQLCISPIHRFAHRKIHFLSCTHHNEVGNVSHIVSWFKIIQFHWNIDWSKFFLFYRWYYFVSHVSSL